MYNNLTCALQRKNQFDDQSQFHVAAVFFPQLRPEGMLSERFNKAALRKNEHVA